MADTRGNLKNTQDERELTDAEEYRRRIEALDERIQQLYDERHRIIEIHRNRKDGIHECAAHQEEERRKHKGYGTREEESFRKAEQEINQDVNNLFGDSRNKLKTIDERIQELEVEDEKTRLRKDWKQWVDSIAGRKQALTEEPVKEQRSLVKNVGRMPEDQYTNIQSNLPFLVDNLIPDNLIDHLFSKGVFDDDDLEKINKEKENGRRAVVYQMLMILLKCGERAYELFIKLLQEEGFIRAVEILENVPQTNTGRVRGRIPQIEYDRLISHYNYLIHTIDPWTLSTRLLTNKVIDQDELEQITNQKLEGRSDVACKLLNILMYCGPGTLDILVRSLREEGCAEIADQLESEKPPPQESKLFKPNEFKNPKLMKAEENGKIMLEMIKANSYPETRAYNEGCKILNNNYILGVIGATGDGKTVLSSMVASNFLENHPDFAPLVIKLSDIDDISFSENRNMLLIMDDILGRFDRSNVNISTLQVNFNNLYLHIKRRKVALIYVIRDYIYNDCNHVRNIYDIFFYEYCIFLHKESLCLNSQERAEIVKYHSNNLQESDIINITENTATSFGFPSIVKLLSKLLSTGKQVEIFTFKSLNEFLSSNFEMFWKEHKDKYACFLLAFIFQPVSVKTLQSGSSSDDQSLVSRIQYDVCENFNMFQALEVFENWSESFYTRDENNCFIFREFVDEAFLIHMLPKFTDLAIKFAPFQLLMEMMRTESDKRTVTSKQCDSIRIEFYPNLADRFINEFRNCNFNVIFHQAFLDERFLLTLVKLAQYNDLMNHYTSIPCGIVGDINDAGNFLHFICLHGSSTCLKTVLSPTTETYLKSETENGHNICDLVAISEVDAIAKLDLLAVNYKHLFRNTMLHMAVQSKQLDVVKHVLEYNIFDITTLNRNLQSVLHSACFSIHDAPDIVEFLAIIKGIDINTKDDDGLTPLHYAVKSGKTKTTALLLNLKSDVNMEDKSGRLPIHWGCCSNASLSDVDKAKIVTLLVNQGSDINHKDTDGRTPILEALSNCQTETVEYLLSVECDVNIKDKKGTSVIQEACTNMKQHFTLINDLLKVVNFPVHEAVLWFEDVHKLNKFLDKNIDQINSLNADGELPLHKACISIYKPTEKAELLLYKGAHTNLNKHPNVCLFHSTVCRLAPISVMKFLVDIDFNFDIIGDDGETSLMCCCRSGVDQVEKVKFILTNRDTTRTKDGEGQGALHYACLYSQVECVKIMMDKGANVNDIDVNGRSPLFRCIRSKVDRIKKMKLLFSRGADVNAVDKYGNTALYHGVLFNTPDCIRILIECGANVNAVVKYGNTVLHDCAMHNTPECIRILIECGADVNAVNRDGRTALHYGVRYNTPECMRILIEGRADVNAVDRYGNTALHGGVIGNTPDCIRILIEGGANVNAVNHDGNTALHDGVKHNRTDCIRILIEGGANVNAVDHDGNTALHHGVRHNSTECIRILIECGADVNAVGKYGETALHLGVRHNKTECIRILIECGADVNAVDHDGKTALHHGVIDNTPDCMRILIEGRANVNAVDHDGNTALHHCIIEGNVKNLQILNELEVRVNMKNKDGNKPIYYCCETRTDPVEKLKLLLNAGAELNYWTKRKMRRHKKTSPELKQYLKTL